MSDAIPCHDAVRRLWDYLDGDVAPDERERIDAHLTFCLRCCGEMEFAQELRRLLRERAVAQPPTPARTRLESFIDGIGTLPVEDLMNAVSPDGGRPPSHDAQPDDPARRDRDDP